MNPIVNKQVRDPRKRARKPVWRVGRKLGRTAEVFWSRVRKTDGCWLWEGGLTPSGYGQMRGREGEGTLLAHRFSYQSLVGPIPPGLSLDHLCRIKNCVNPAHLEPVTSEENFRRSPLWVGNRTECPSGHPYEGNNVSVKTTGARGCKQCARDYAERQRRKRGVPVKGAATHCGAGHLFSDENTRLRANGRRGCRTCDRVNAAAKRKAAATMTWRCGGKTGRNVYMHDTLVGMMDTPGIAKLVVDVMNLMTEAAVEAHE